MSDLSKNNMKLPDGPLMINQEKLWSSFLNEIIKNKSLEYKFECLQSIKSLFSNEKDIFIGGLGNRMNVN